MEDENGKLLGYRGLDQIHRKLEPILLRRTRKKVLKDLPPRTDQIFRVPLTKEQAEPYWEQHDILARLMHKWQSKGWLSEIDLRRITCCLQNMRMLCNSTYLFDKRTHHSPKLAEFREIIRELALEEKRKVVVFSEYERMTYLAGEELRKLKIGFVSLHGGVPPRKRGELIDTFHRDAECRVFLSTDAGGVGLNLQVASAVVNFEPPWNPARLEQRIGRVHRLGQAHPVQVIHLLTEKTIEERVWEILELKKSLFAGVFDSPTAEISFAKLGRKSVLQAVKEIFADQPGRPKPIIDSAPPQPIPVAAATAPAPVAAAEIVAPLPLAVAPGDTDSAPSAVPEAELGPLEKAAGGLINAGLAFLEAITESAGNGLSARLGETRHPLSALFSRDPRTNRPILSIPLPASVTEERLANAVTGFLRGLRTS